MGNGLICIYLTRILYIKCQKDSLSRRLFIIDAALVGLKDGWELELGFTDGAVLGILLGIVLGDVLGIVLGDVLGIVVGIMLGIVVGRVLGDVLGGVLGGVLGKILGDVLGILLGDEEGKILGLEDGKVVGLVEGIELRLGEFDESITGDALGKTLRSFDCTMDGVNDGEALVLSIGDILDGLCDGSDVGIFEG